MAEKRIEIEGITFDLKDAEDKKAAIRAWLEMRSREREGGEKPAGEDSQDGPRPEDA